MTFHKLTAFFSVICEKYQLNILNLNKSPYLYVPLYKPFDYRNIIFNKYMNNFNIKRKIVD